ncbi:MAG: hypothetical protein KF851_09785 [Pirellulaceae bacterium]|nr:hypothetical protein [Pirellulaceae bacterium]
MRVFTAKRLVSQHGFWRSVSVAFLFLLLSPKPFCFGGLSQVMQGDDKSVCQVFRNLLFNIQAIESGDVLMVCREEYDSINLADSITNKEVIDPDGVLSESVTSVRFRFDIRRNFYAWVIHEKYNTTTTKPIQNQGEETPIYSRKWEVLKVVLIDKNQRIDFVWSPNKQPIRTVKILENEGFPDDLPTYRSSVYQGSLKPMPWEKAVSSVERAVSGKDFWRSSHDDDGNLRIIFRSELHGHEIDCLFYEYVIDSGSQMVVASEMYNADEFGNDRAIGFRNKSEWEPRGDIYVPMKKRYEAPGVVEILDKEGDNKEKQFGVFWRYRDLDYSWYSLNDVVEEAWFEESTYDSLEKIKELLFVQDQKENAIKDEK